MCQGNRGSRWGWRSRKKLDHKGIVPDGKEFGPLLLSVRKRVESKGRTRNNLCFMKIFTAEEGDWIRGDKNT